MLFHISMDISLFLFFFSYCFAVKAEWVMPMDCLPDDAFHKITNTSEKWGTSKASQLHIISLTQEGLLLATSLPLCMYASAFVCAGRCQLPAQHICETGNSAQDIAPAYSPCWPHPTQSTAHPAFLPKPPAQTWGQIQNRAKTYSHTNPKVGKALRLRW